MFGYNLVKTDELSTLKATSAAHAAVTAQRVAVRMELDTLTAEHQRVLDVQGQALLLVINNGPFFQQLTGLSGVDAPTGTFMGSLGSDGQSVVVDLGAASFVLNPWTQTITVVDAGSGRTRIPSITVPCANAHISVVDQTQVLGHVRRIMVNAETGIDPVGADFTATPKLVEATVGSDSEETGDQPTS